jgi:plasmid stabilization system protein ParE
MKRRLVVTPRARREFLAIVEWYRSELGAGAAAKVARSLRTGIEAATRINPEAATREDLPEGYYRVVARAHLVIFRIEGDKIRVYRIVHGARDLPSLLADE